MENRIIKISVVALLICSASCTSMKRYKTMESSTFDSTLADISLFGSKLIPSGPLETGKSLWDLSADAQSQFIKILNTRFPDNEMFLNALSNLYMKGGEELFSDDYVHKNMRLIFSISRRREYKKANVLQTAELSPADRLEFIKITLVTRDHYLRFTGWNLFETEYGSVDIGDLSFSRSLDLSTSASLSGKKEGPGISAESSSSVNRKEDQSVRYRYLKLNGRLNDQMIEMEEEGTREIDLTGNIIAEVSMEFESTGEMVTVIKGLKDSSGVFIQPEKLPIKRFVVNIPDIGKIEDGIKADLKMDFVYRNVKRGRKTFPEWDDRVKYYTGSVKKPVLLLMDRDYVPGFCSLGTGQGADKKEFLTIEKKTGESWPLIFRSYGEAADFNEWLVWFMGKNGDKPLKIGGYNLQFKGKYLTSDIIIKESLFGVVPYYW